MMIEDDIFDGDGGGSKVAEGITEEVREVNEEASVIESDTSEFDNADSSFSCLSCGVQSFGTYCVNCGQKNDDMRRSSFMLAKDFIEDTFSFDGRMWRTLGLLAVAPGSVPTSYAHGKRSRFTPPVRLFLVVSFLFFLTLSLTNTLFMAIEIQGKDPATEAERRANSEGRIVEMELGDARSACNINMGLRLFVNADVIVNDEVAWEKCVAGIKGQAQESMNKQTLEMELEGDAEISVQGEKVLGFMENIFDGLTRAVEDPKKFNAVFNNWLPRVMLVMTPIMAILLSSFLRGPNALFFDHMVLSFYTHAVGFGVAIFAILAAQANLQAVGWIVSIGVFLYFTLALKRAYERGWIKTVYTSTMVMVLYGLILVMTVIAIVTRIVWMG